ncbi:MAG: hypothetical protein Q8O10_10325 [candidate division Zixibacteria bacterium]|nr:hypothetical protein [candidate division Zixibacteria bacterium]
MIKVPLIGKYEGQYALVDDQDVWVLKFRWFGKTDRPNLIYASVSTRKEGLNKARLETRSEFLRILANKRS